MVFNLVVQLAYCWAGRCYNQPSTGVAKVMDGQNKSDRTVAGKGWQGGMAAGDESVNNCMMTKAADDQTAYQVAEAVVATTTTKKMMTMTTTMMTTTTLDQGQQLSDRHRAPMHVHQCQVHQADDPCWPPVEDLLGIVFVQTGPRRCHLSHGPQLRQIVSFVFAFIFAFHQ